MQSNLSTLLSHLVKPIRLPTQIKQFHILRNRLKGKHVALLANQARRKQAEVADVCPDINKSIRGRNTWRKRSVTDGSYVVAA